MSDEIHFTYQRPAGADLEQGDLLEKDGELLALLAKVHPHYHERDDYSHLLVVSQTCDLVRRRGGVTNSRYITLVAVRNLETILERELEKHQDQFCQRLGLCATSKKSKIQEYLSSLFNNNKTEYFYLHPDASMGLTSPVCAFLRLPISIRAGEHYEKCLNARILSLSEPFRAKLGHHLGVLYSRIGTEDWVPNNIDPKGFKKLVKGHLDGVAQWVEDEKLKNFRAEFADSLPKMIEDRDLFAEKFRRFKFQDRKAKVIARIRELAPTLELDEKAVNRLVAKIAADPEITTYLR